MYKPTATEYAPFYETYVKLVPDIELMDAFTQSFIITDQIWEKILESKADYQYAANKWTITQVVQHIIDTERIFTFRALCFARGEQQPIFGFDENTYADQATVTHRKLQDIQAEWFFLRQSTTHLFGSFNEEMLQKKGIANGNMISVNALGYIIIGHSLHHFNILKERYL
jgi:hypothetical protein